MAGLYFCRYKNSAEILDKLGGVTRLSALVSHADITSIQATKGSHIPTDTVVSILKDMDPQSLNISHSCTPLHPSSPSPGQAEPEECEPYVSENVSFASGAEALVAISRHLLVE